MKVGLFFGSFNPIHIGHLVIASYMVDFTPLDQIWFVVSPQNPLKPRKGLLDEYKRLDLVKTAIENDPRFRTTDIEFSLPRPSYTIETLIHLKEKFPDKEFILIMGTDNLPTLNKWKNFEEILRSYHIYAYGRPRVELDRASLHPSITLFEDVPMMDISATFIRESLKDRKSVRYLLPEKVWLEVEKWGYYL